MPNLLQAKDRILFQGDSITDADRRGGAKPLGNGYPAMVAGMLQANQAELQLTVQNRGVSGDRTAELLKRWQVDCLDLKPTVLSIKIGVNDLWRKLGEWNGQKYIPLDEYRTNLESLCDQAMKAGVRLLVLISPTSIKADNNDPLNVELGAYAEAAHTIATHRGGVYVDARTPLLAARETVKDIPWTPDGCHPSVAGHALIAAAWYKAVVG
jgi:acyl-CoA thioesterase I